MESMVFAGSVVTLYREDSGDERRVVQATFDEGGYLLVGEQSEGCVSLGAFGTPSHYHQVVISHESFDLLEGELCVPAGSGCVAILEALCRYFRSSGAFLSEFMDRLDGAHIPYGYLPAASTVLASYRPARRDDGSSY